MNNPGTAFVISVGHGIDQSVYADMVSGFEEAGLPVILEQREPEFLPLSSTLLLRLWSLTYASLTSRSS